METRNADSVSSGATFYGVDVPTGTGAEGSEGSGLMASVPSTSIAVGPESNLRMPQDGGNVAQLGQLDGQPWTDADVIHTGAGQGHSVMTGHHPNATGA